MTNHYHLLIHTPDPNLSRGMRDVNGIYTQRFNRRHGKVGHVLQGRYTAHLIDRDAYLLEVARYVVLNPVGARMVTGPRLYPWSSYRSTIGQQSVPEWLAVDDLLRNFAKRRSTAVQKYRQYVHDGIAHGGKLDPPRHALFFGDENFVSRMLAKLDLPDELPERTRIQRNLNAKSLEWYAGQYERDLAIAKAWESGSYTLREIGDHCGLHYQSISRIARAQRHA